MRFKTALILILVFMYSQFLSAEIGYFSYCQNTVFDVAEELVKICAGAPQSDTDSPKCKNAFVDGMNSILDVCVVDESNLSPQCQRRLYEATDKVAAQCWSGECEKAIVSGIYGVIDGCMLQIYRWQDNIPYPESLRDLGVQFAGMLPQLLVNAGIPMPVYGNYCGPHYGDRSYLVEPVDGLDAACMRHDRCYDIAHKGLYQSCYCDSQFVRDIDKWLSSDEEGTLWSNIAAFGLRTWFKSSPCVCKDTATGKTSLLERAKLSQKGQCGI